MSCPVCYEVYDDVNVICRKLQCGDHICWKCVAADTYNENDNDTYYCPECGYLNIATPDQNISEAIDDFNTIISNNTDNDDHSDDNDNNNDGIFNELSTVVRQQSANRCLCSEANCSNKEIAFGYCLRHSKKRHSADLMMTEMIAKDIEQGSLKKSFSSLSSSLSSLSSRKIIDNPYELAEYFKQEKLLTMDEAMDLIDKAKVIMIKEQNILYLDAPINTVGDIHGQYYDLLNLLEEGGKPNNNKSYLFLGDYVDRGSFSCEVMLLLISLKVAYPTNIWLIRGNHESRSVSGHFGFKEECKNKYGLNVYYKFLLLFQTMPLAAVVSTNYGNIFLCHGGLSPNFKTVEEIERIDRFVEPEANPALLDLLWSDPICEEEMENMSLEEYQNFIELEWRANSSRGCSYLFGYKIVKEFLEVNNFVCIIRAHEVQEDGFRKHFDPTQLEKKMKKLLENWCQNVSTFEGETPETLMNTISLPYSTKSPMPPLLTIFSAPNYCDRYENKGAILMIDKELNDFRIIQYDCVEHPAGSIEGNQTENSIVDIIAACPYMPSSLKMFVKYAVDLVPEESFIFEADSNDCDDNSMRASSTDEELSISPTRKSSVSAKRSISISIPLKSKEGDVKQITPGLSESTYGTPKNSTKDFNNRRRISGFEQALASDAINELHPELSPMGIKEVMSKSEGAPLRSLSIRTDELQAVGVQELRKRFENGNLGSSSGDSTSIGSNLGSSSNDDRASISSTRFAEIRNQFEKTETVVTRKSERRVTIVTSDSPPTSPLSPQSENTMFKNSNEQSTLSKLFGNDEVATTSNSTTTSTTTGVSKGQSNNNASVEMLSGNVLFSEAEIVALRLMFSFFDRSGSNTITYEDLIAYAEETGETTCIRDAGIALDHLDIDGDGKIGLLDFFYFAARLKATFVT